MNLPLDVLSHIMRFLRGAEAGLAEFAMQPRPPCEDEQSSICRAIRAIAYDARLICPARREKESFAHLLAFIQYRSRALHTYRMYAGGDLYAGGLRLLNGHVLHSSMPTRVAMSGKVRQVAAGTAHSLVLTLSGEVWAFGTGGFGALGQGEGAYADHAEPMLVALPVPAIQVAAGTSSSAAVLQNGELWMWGGMVDAADTGSDDVMSVGPGTGHPTRTEGVTGVTQVALGNGGHGLALTATGAVYAWGENYDGQLGMGDQLDRTEPTLVPLFSAGERGVQVAVGERHSMVLSAKGTVWAFGARGNGKLGIGAVLPGPQPTPMRVKRTWHDAAHPATVMSISANGDHSAMVLSNGQLWICGDEGVVRGNGASDGQVTPSIRFVATRVENIPPVQSVCMGVGTVAAVTVDGCALTWGMGALLPWRVLQALVGNDDDWIGMIRCMQLPGDLSLAGAVSSASVWGGAHALFVMQ